MNFNEIKINKLHGYVNMLASIIEENSTKEIVKNNIEKENQKNKYR